MEPVVIIVKDIKNGKILLTEDELKTIVRRAYNDGYWEGKKNNWYCDGITYTNTNPYITTTNGTSSNPDKYNNITITCDTNKEVNEVMGQINLFDSIIGDFIND